MLFGKRETRPSAAARRRGAFRPEAQDLEARTLMAIDVGATVPPLLPDIATVPFGVLNASSQGGGGAGFSSAQVGDVNGDTYDDVLVGAPGVGSPGSLLGLLRPGSSTARAYLVFGSSQVQQGATAGIADWLTLDNAGQRVGDLNQIGNVGQVNPINPNATVNNFNGIRFVTNTQGSASLLGTSVAPAGVINNTPAFLIGAPGAVDRNGLNPGTGRAYLVYGNGLSLQNVPTRQVDLDVNTPGVSVVTFVNSTALGGQAGYSVSSVFNLLGDGGNDVVIGAPFAGVGGRVNTGTVYVIPAASIPSTSATIDLAAVGQVGGIPGVVLSGTNPGDLFGWSVADAGNIDGDTSGSQNLDDLLIGAPGVNGAAGASYLVYGAGNFATTAIPSAGSIIVPAENIGGAGDSITNPLPGIVLLGTNQGGFTGYSVNTAGFPDFTGLSSFIVGSPGVNGFAGSATVIYGSTTGRKTGIFALPDTSRVTSFPLPIEVNQPSSTLLSANYLGIAAGDLTGYSVSSVGPLGNSVGNGIVIGAPGVQGNQGEAFLIPGTSNLAPGSTTTGYTNRVGSFGLRLAGSPTDGGTEVFLTTPTTSGTVGPFFGASVSGRLVSSIQAHTLDSDLIPDVTIGAPGYTASSGNTRGGGVFNLEGALIAASLNPLNVGNVLLSGGTAITSVNATAATVTFTILSNALTTPAFNPSTDIDPARLVINGFRPAGPVTLTTLADANGDGIPDATLVVPIADIRLPANSTPTTATVVQIGGFTNSSTLGNSSNFWLGNAPGSTGTPTPTPTTGGTVSATVPVGFFGETQFIPQFGPDRYVPPLTALSRNSSYKPIPLRVALRQYQAQPGFNARIQQYFNPTSAGLRPTYHNTLYGQEHFHTSISKRVLSRSKFHAGKVITFTHREHVVPTNLQREEFSPTPAARRHHKR